MRCMCSSILKDIVDAVYYRSCGDTSSGQLKKAGGNCSPMVYV